MKYSEQQRNNSDIAIKARDITFYFGKVKALDSFDLQVKHGSICGLIGNNGAGKTTAIHALLGFLPTSKGQMSVLGLDSNKKNTEILKSVGFFPEKVEPYNWMKVKTLFQMGSHAYPSWDKNTCHDLCRTFDLDTSKTMKQLTKGMFAKTKLIYALSHHPQCLILDEPISGLDPASRDELLAIIGKLTQQQNVTTLISSHSLYELSDIATDICIIHKGRSIFSAGMDQINNRIAILEIRRPELNVPPALNDIIIKTRTKEPITQFLIQDKHDSRLHEFLNHQKDNEFTLKEISLKELFLFLTKDQLVSWT